MNPHTPVRRSGRLAGGAAPTLLKLESAEVTKSTATFDSPLHTQSKHSTRIQLKSPFREAHKENDPNRANCHTTTSHLDSTAMEEEETLDSSTSTSIKPISSTTAAPCPSSLPLPFPHRNAPSRNVLHSINARESCSLGRSPHTFKRRTNAHQFGRFELKRSTQCFDPTHHGHELELLNMQKRGKILEIIAVGNFVFVLTHAGVCVAFDNRNLKRLCYLNIISDEVIRSLFYNKVNQSLITVSVYRHDNFTSLRCRSTSFDAIAAGKPELGIFLFPGESLAWPGFVEFDDVNKKVLTYSAQAKSYKIWDLATYNLMYQPISDPRIEEVKISPGIMILIMKRQNTSIPIQIRAIDTGELLQQIDYNVPKTQKLQFIEQFNEKLLIKQKKQPLHMVDILHPEKSTYVSEDLFTTPAAFIFLYENHIFLTFIKREIAVWNFDGKRVAKFEDHFNWWADCNTNNVYINTDQDMLISYCLSPEQVTAMQQRETNPLGWKKAKKRTGSINISNIFTGECMGKIEKRKQLKYPYQLLTHQQQQSALADYKRVHGKRRLRQVLEGMPVLPSVMSVDPLTRARELQAEERSLHMLLQINAQEQQQLMQTPTAAAAHSTTHQPTTSASTLPSTTALHEMSDAVMRDDADEDDLEDWVDCDCDDQDHDYRTLEAYMNDLDEEEEDGDESDSSSHSTDDEHEAEAAEQLEQLGQMSQAKVLFPFQSPETNTTTSSLTNSSAPKPIHQLPPHNLDLPDLAAYRAYNRGVRKRNAALKNITAVYYHEERNEIYTGNQAGKLHVWAH